MNKIAVIFDVPGFTQKNYDDIAAELKAIGKFPNENCLSHVAFQKGANWCVVDVWNSEESFREFGQNTLFPVFGKLGLTLPAPQIFSIHLFTGTGVEAVTPA